MRNKVSAILAIGLLSACVSTQSEVQKPQKATQTPQQTEVAPETEASDITQAEGTVIQEQEAQGKLVVYRDGIIGLALMPKIRIDNKVYGTMSAASYFSCDLPTGTYELEAKTENTSKATVTIEAGQTQYVRTVITFGALIGRVKLENIDEGTGQGKIAKLKQKTAPCGIE